MSVELESAKRIAALTDKINAVTEKSDATLAEAVNSVIDGYGSYDKGYEDGQKSEYDRFWDAYQNYGARTYYRHAFAGDAWGASGLLPPKYPIVLEQGISVHEGMFEAFNVYGTNLYDMTEICKMIDFSRCTNASRMFNNAKIKNVTCDFSSVQRMQTTFGCGNGGYMDNITLKVTDNLLTFGSTFEYAYALKTLIFTDDSTIPASLDVGWSTVLSKDSIRSIMHALSSEATEMYVKFSKTAVNAAFETSTGAADGTSSTEWQELIATKPNWTISLV